MNNKGFTVVELLASFTLTMVIVVFLFEIVLELKDIYINSGLKTQVVNKNAIIANNLNTRFSENKVATANCDNSTYQCTVIYLDGTSETFTVTRQGVVINGVNINMPDDVTIDTSSIKVEAFGPDSTLTGTTNDNSYIKVSFTSQSSKLTQNIDFNYIYTYNQF